MNEGFIFIHRKLRENPIYKNSKAIHIWLECLLRASHKQNIFYSKKEKVILEKGQFLMGRDEFGESVGISGSTVWFWLKQFKADSMVDIKTSTKGTIVTVKNWDTYQKLDSEINSKKTAKKQQKNTNNNDNNDNNDNNIYIAKNISEDFINPKSEIQEEKHEDKKRNRVLKEDVKIFASRNHVRQEDYISPEVLDSILNLYNNIKFTNPKRPEYLRDVDDSELLLLGIEVGLNPLIIQKIANELYPKYESGYRIQSHTKIHDFKMFLFGIIRRDQIRFRQQYGELLTWNIPYGKS